MKIFKEQTHHPHHSSHASPYLFLLTSGGLNFDSWYILSLHAYNASQKNERIYYSPPFWVPPERIPEAYTKGLTCHHPTHTTPSMPTTQSLQVKCTLHSNSHSKNMAPSWLLVLQFEGGGTVHALTHKASLCTELKNKQRNTQQYRALHDSILYIF